MERPKTKIFGFFTEEIDRQYHCAVITEEGRIIAHHVSNSEWDMSRDLGMKGFMSSVKHKIYDHKCPNGWIAEYVPRTQIAEHPGLQAALKKLVERQDLESTAEQSDD